MTPTECPRCVAERRARRAMNLVALLAMGASIAPCMAGEMYSPGASAISRLLRAQCFAYCGMVVALLFAGLALALRRLALRASRAASTPLLPSATPLATYREAPPECPRHPFVR